MCLFVSPLQQLRAQARPTEAHASPQKRWSSDVTAVGTQRTSLLRTTRWATAVGILGVSQGARTEQETDSAKPDKAEYRTGRKRDDLSGPQPAQHASSCLLLLLLPAPVARPAQHLAQHAPERRTHFSLGADQQSSQPTGRGRRLSTRVEMHSKQKRSRVPDLSHLSLCLALPAEPGLPLDAPTRESGNH
jgi:hypothetical protein